MEKYRMESLEKVLFIVANKLTLPENARTFLDHKNLQINQSNCQNGTSVQFPPPPPFQKIIKDNQKTP